MTSGFAVIMPLTDSMTTRIETNTPWIDRPHRQKPLTDSMTTRIETPICRKSLARGAEPLTDFHDNKD